ncbi:MAG: hypothetical protein WC529_00380 [Candidatus Margulisiibacteriota bacterium]
MIAKVTISLKQRTIGRLGLLFNRITPTRGAKTVATTLFGFNLDNHARIIVSPEHLSLQTPQKQIVLHRSEHYARALAKAGVQEIDLAPGLGSLQIKEMLNLLTDHSLSVTRRLLGQADGELYLLDEKTPLLRQQLRRRSLLATALFGGLEPQWPSSRTTLFSVLGLLFGCGAGYMLSEPNPHEPLAKYLATTLVILSAAAGTVTGLFAATRWTRPLHNIAHLRERYVQTRERLLWPEKGAAAMSPDADPETVVQLLRHLPKDEYLKGYRFEHFHEVNIDTYEVTASSSKPRGWRPAFGYVGESLKIARKAIERHEQDREQIMAGLAGVNPELHLALISDRTPSSAP